MRDRLPFAIAGTYWIGAIALFFVFALSGFDMIGEGAVPIAIITLPWSQLIVIFGAAGSSDRFMKPVVDSLISTTGTFVLFPVLCGGLNAAVLFFGIRYWKRRKDPQRKGQANC